MSKIFNKDMNKPSGHTINNKSNKTLEGAIAKSNHKATNMSKYSDKYYKCYSIKLNEFLKSNNLKTIKEVRNPKTDKIAFIYEKTNQLDELLTIWTNNKDKMSNDAK
ncbi:MAG: DUF5659 domain-containing protein [Bacillota bacterium]|nr:DUF5659 domain-containing protein [Bacillota bacterium]